jgi:16S rRNA processing protein RimM
MACASDSGPAAATEASASEDWTWLGRIRRPQGRKGEVFANILTDFPEKFAERRRLWLLKERPSRETQSKPPEVSGHDFKACPERSRMGAVNTANSTRALAPVGPSVAGTAPREVELIAHWPHKGGIVLHFAGVDSISAAETLKGLIVAIPRGERAALGEDEVYVGDLIGCALVDVAGGASVVVGEIEEVDRTAGPVALLVVRGAVGEVLIPFAKSYLRGIDLAARRVEMALPEGLVELNVPSDLKPNQLTQETMRNTAQGAEVHQAEDAAELFKKLGI